MSKLRTHKLAETIKPIGNGELSKLRRAYTIRLAKGIVLGFRNNVLTKYD